MNRRNVVSVHPALDTSYHPPPSIRALGPLLIPPHSVARKALDVCQGAFMDAAEALRRSREHDARHDTALMLADSLAERGVPLALVSDAPQLAARFKAIRRAIRTARAADEREDSLIAAALVICRRLTAAIEKLFARRARRTRP
jgi:hypothetical protein